MAKKITIGQLKRAVKTAPQAVMRYGTEYIRDGINVYQRIVQNTAPWRVGGSGGGVPKDTGNLQQRHYKKVGGLEGRYGVKPNNVKYALAVHEGTKKMEARPWLDFAKRKGDKEVEKLYQEFGDKILKHIAQ